MADARMLSGPSSGERAAALDDAAVVARLRRRDETALAEVYDAHAGAVYGVLLRMLDDGSAQEVTQDVFLKLWDKPAAFDASRGSLRAFLLVMARSRGLDRLRATRTTVPLYAEDGAELPLPDSRPGPDHHSETAQRRERIRAALAELSGPHRETVERAFLRGQTREEIAAQMAVPVGTVKSRVSYALKHLKRVLGEEVGAWLD
ncbi:RNA polymerase sigma-70 factor (ECF subfamily) [Deinococcus metalli]|uniref:RNA polymerase sigma factor n=1 Tax=Deinococcus metalli TaxID=1141878 RepID=A0A7W8NNZ7_9DEIO|nr:sigma-70 family RNA polymerase sigma factor [Deinococcus metalli]MBB5376281.1 RNA polymerase sigma-70 factor (ECF subfamily) [Deinococcus metalli]GHF39490.1 RNA polymerase sigma factor [Deinococcus metalli]